MKKSGVRSQESAVRSQEPRVRRRLSPASYLRSPISCLRSPLLPLALCIVTAFSASAEGDVAGCTEGDLLDALDGGGLVTFTNDCSITLSAPIIIDLDTTIDAQGHQVTISGGDLTLLFQVEPDVTSFTAIGLTLSGGQNTNGGALYIYEGATVVLSNCTFQANTAAGEDGSDGADGSNSASGSGGNGKSGTIGTAGLGAAIFNLGDLTLINCTLASNTITGGDGGN